MPSANIAVVKTTSTSSNSGDMDYINQPMKPALTIVEHKIRNLEKRKGKLDQYNREQDAGKELNADQLAAVAKYGEVIQQLDLARDLMKQLAQANDETRKEIRKQRKTELAERNLYETEKLRMMFLFEMVIKELENCDLSNEKHGNDNSDLKSAVLVIKKHQFLRYFELLKSDDLNLQSNLDMLASNWFQVLDGGKKFVDSQSGKDRITFKNIQDSLLAVLSSDYFVSKQCRKEPVVVEEEVVVVVQEDNNTNNISDSIPSSATNTNTTTSINNNTNNNANNSIPQDIHRVGLSPTSVVTSTPAPPMTQAAPVCQIKDSAYSFLQDSQIDMESPHFDPAVVAVSSCLPPRPTNPQVDHHQVVRNPRNAYTITTPSAQGQQQLGVSMTNGIGDRVVADYGGKKLMPLLDEKITEWNANDVHQNGNDRNGSGGGDDNNRGFGSNNRSRTSGGGRGGFRRGASNGFPPRNNSRGNSRQGSGGGGAFSGPGGNNRIGYFRSGDQQQEQQTTFVEGGRAEYNPRGPRNERNDGRNSIVGWGGGERPPRVNGGGRISQGNGGNNYANNNGGGGYRGGARGGGVNNNNNKPAPRTSENNGLMAAKCY